MGLFSKQKVSLLLLLSNLFIAFLGIGLVVPIMPSYMKELQLSGEIMGYLIAAFAFAQLLVSPISGVWVDKIGRKKMIVSGLFIFSFSELIFGLGNQVWVLFVSRVLGGISAAFIMPAVTAFVADITTAKERPKALGYVSAAISAGFIIGPGIGGFIAGLGVRAPFFFAAAIALVAAIFSLLILKEPLSKEQLEEIERNNTKISFWRELKKSFQPIYFIPLIIVFVLAFGLSVYETMFGLFVDEKFGFTPKDISVIITVGAVFGVIAQVVFFGKLVERLGEKLLIQGTLLFAAVFITLSVFVSGYWMIMAVTFIVFLASDLLRPALTTLLSRLAGEEQGFVAGMNSTYTSLGNIIGPALAGILFDWNINLPYLFATIILAAGFVMTIAWKGKEQMRLDEI
ncbi:MFS transporter [Peribacillus cavernae]|uniref:MFS transporter n=1 Tax=Peribacillus cavernae TaxID=1674310 RepID=A0A433HRJ6_9BACI|nr:MFS transporter [Peribacillus cavernae]MDQ0218797.1 DHA1 family multidrug resistance protein-like MFS transporter [Peribacillus cavernae]RUQ31006.1 MFS transporter [Peribacillus cavernae]